VIVFVQMDLVGLCIWRIEKWGSQAVAWCWSTFTWGLLTLLGCVVVNDLIFSPYNFSEIREHINLTFGGFNMWLMLDHGRTAEVDGQFITEF